MSVRALPLWILIVAGPAIMMTAPVWAQTLSGDALQLWLHDADRDHNGVNDQLEFRFGDDGDQDGVPDELERILTDDYGYTGATDDAEAMFYFDGDQDGIADILEEVGVLDQSQNSIGISTPQAQTAREGLVELTHAQLGLANAVGNEMVPFLRISDHPICPAPDAASAIAWPYNALAVCPRINGEAGVPSGLHRIGWYGFDAAGRLLRATSGSDANVEITVNPAIAFEYAYLAPEQNDSEVEVWFALNGPIPGSSSGQKDILLTIQPPGQDFEGQLITPDGTIIDATTTQPITVTVPLDWNVSGGRAALRLGVADVDEDEGIELPAGDVEIEFGAGLSPIVLGSNDSVTLNFSDGANDSGISPDLNIEVLVSGEEVLRSQYTILTSVKADLTLRAWVSNRRLRGTRALSFSWEPLPEVFTLEDRNPIEIAGSNNGLALGTPQAGVYTVQAQVGDRTNQVKRSATVRVIDALNEQNLSEFEDQDRDGYADRADGLGDQDNDGILNYRDPYPNSAQVIPVAFRTQDALGAAVLRAKSLDNQPLSMRLGRMAQAADYPGARIAMADLNAYGALDEDRSDQVTFVAPTQSVIEELFFNHDDFGVIDVEVTLPLEQSQAYLFVELANSVQQLQAENGLSVRWYQAYKQGRGGWHAWIETIEDEGSLEEEEPATEAWISAKLPNGICPDIALLYQRSVEAAQVGDQCLLLKLQDGWRGDDRCESECATERDGRVMVTVALASRSQALVSRPSAKVVAPVQVGAGCSLNTRSNPATAWLIYALLMVALLRILMSWKSRKPQLYSAAATIQAPPKSPHLSPWYRPSLTKKSLEE